MHSAINTPILALKYQIMRFLTLSFSSELFSPHIPDNALFSHIHFLLSVLSSTHPSDITLFSPISLLLSTLSSPRIPDNMLSSHIFSF